MEFTGLSPEFTSILFTVVSLCLGFCSLLLTKSELKGLGLQSVVRRLPVTALGLQFSPRSLVVSRLVPLGRPRLSGLLGGTPVMKCPCRCFLGFIHPLPSAQTPPVSENSPISEGRVVGEKMTLYVEELV